MALSDLQLQMLARDALQRAAAGDFAGAEAMFAQVADAWPNVFRQGELIPAVEYLRANRIRTLLMQEMDELMRTVDVEKSIEQDHPARGIWAAVEQLEMTPFERSIRAVDTRAKAHWIREC